MSKRIRAGIQDIATRVAAKSSCIGLTTEGLAELIADKMCLPIEKARKLIDAAMAQSLFKECSKHRGRWLLRKP